MVDTTRTSIPFRYCFTLDTEPDDMWGASHSTNTFSHVLRMPDFHRRICEAGARPTYLTTSEVAESTEGKKAMRQIMELGDCEIGAHFHTWTRDWPFPTPDLGNPPLKALAHQLGQPLEEKMLAHTCQSLREHLGVEPRSYRGGRWSLNRESFRSLANCGIVVDSTITPGISWRDTQHQWLDGPDWRNLPCKPHVVDVPETDAQGEGNSQVVELPVGAANFYPRWLPSALRGSRFGRKLGKLPGLGSKRIGHRWLRPTTMSLSDMRAVMNSLKASDCPIWVLMIHSSELSPCTPLPTEADVERFVQRCVEVVHAAAELGATPATLEEAGTWFLDRESGSQDRLEPART